MRSSDNISQMLKTVFQFVVEHSPLQLRSFQSCWLLDCLVDGFVNGYFNESNIFSATLTWSLNNTTFYPGPLSRKIPATWNTILAKIELADPIDNWQGWVDVVALLLIAPTFVWISSALLVLSICDTIHRFVLLFFCLLSLCILVVLFDLFLFFNVYWKSQAINNI